VSAEYLSEIGDLSRYTKNIELSGGLGVGVSTDVLGMMTMSMGGGGRVREGDDGVLDDNDEEEDDNFEDEEGYGEEKGAGSSRHKESTHVTESSAPLSVFQPVTSSSSSSSSSSDTIRGTPETLTSLILVSGAKECALLAQLLTECVSPGALSPSSLFVNPTIMNSSTAARSKESSSSIPPSSTTSTSFVPSRPRLPLPIIALPGCGMGVNAYIGRQSAEAVQGLDVPQILSPASFQHVITSSSSSSSKSSSSLLSSSSSIPIVETLAPFKHATVSSLDLYVRTIREQAEGSSSTRDTVDVYELDIRGPILPFAVERIGKLLSGLQLRESCLSFSTSTTRQPTPLVAASSSEKKRRVIILSLNSSTSHLATSAFSGSASSSSSLSEMATTASSLPSSIALSCVSTRVNSPPLPPNSQGGGSSLNNNYRDWDDLSSFEAFVTSDIIADLKENLSSSESSDRIKLEIEFRKRIRQGRQVVEQGKIFYRKT
jgi:hypothetical protein